jgi:hypothetical protein
LETHGFETIPECRNGRASEFVGGLFGNSQHRADFAVALAVADAFGHKTEAGRERLHRDFQAFPGFKSSGGAVGQGKVGGLNLLYSCLRGGGRLGDWEVQIVNVVPMVADLSFERSRRALRMERAA